MRHSYSGIDDYKIRENLQRNVELSAFLLKYILFDDFSERPAENFLSELPPSFYAED